MIFFVKWPRMRAKSTKKTESKKAKTDLKNRLKSIISFPE